MHITFNSFWEWVKTTFTTSYQDEIHAYLASSTDLHDLEQRMRTLAHRGML